MTPLSPSLLAAAAQSYVGMGVDSPTARGRFVDIMLAGVGQPIQSPWSAAFVHHVGYWSHYDPRSGNSTWPLPATNDPRALAAFGAERGISRDRPERGDVFLFWSLGRTQFTRAGIVVEVDDRVARRPDRQYSWICTTVEGDTTQTGALTGGGIHLLERTLCPLKGDCFLRWPALDARGVAADPTVDAAMEAGRLIVRRAS